MKRLIPIVIMLTPLLLMQGLGTAHAAGQKSGAECKTGTSLDDRQSPTSLRSFETYFNQAVEQDRGCTTKITLQSNIELNRGIVLQGISNSSTHLTIDGGGFTIKAQNIPESDVCVLTIQGSANFVEIKNLIIEGNGTTPLDGICLLTSDNKVVNAQIRRMGRRGIVIAGSRNLIGADTTNSPRKPSLVADCGGPGIYVTQPYTVTNNLVDPDTVLFQNGKGVTTAAATATTASGTTGPSTNPLVDTNSLDAHPFPAPALVPYNSAELGQQVYVEGDQTSYRLNYQRTSSGEVNLTNSTLQLKSGQNGVGGETLLLIVKSEETVGGGSATLDQVLVGVITPLSDTDLTSKYPGIGTNKRLGKIDTKTSKISPIPGKQLKFSASQIYLIVYPQSQSVTSSTGKIDLTIAGTGVNHYCFIANKRDAACEEKENDGGLGDGFGDFEDGGFGSEPSDADGDGVPDGTQFTSHLDVSGLMLSAVQDECIETQFDAQTDYQDNDDLDGDGIASAVEDSATPDCNAEGVETVPYLYDSDGDGLGDGEEDSNRNGYVDCAVWTMEKVNGVLVPKTKGADLVPKFKGVNDQDEPCVEGDSNSCVPKGPFLGKFIPDPSTLGLSIGEGNWRGIPMYKVVTGIGTGATKELVTLGATERVLCTETDPRAADSDGDGLTDGEEDHRLYVDYTEGAYVYDVKTHMKSVDQVVKKGEIACDALLASGNAGKTMRTFVVYNYDSSLRRMTWGDCRLGDPKANPTDFDYQAIEPDVVFGETHPTRADSDFDGVSDKDDACPSDPAPTCEAACARGWRKWQVAQTVGLQVAPGSDALSRQQKYDQGFAELQKIFGRTDVSARDDLKALLNSIPLFRGANSKGNTDGDNIPDLIEAGLPAPGTTIDDCPLDASSFISRTSPFVTWTDKTTVSSATGALDPLKVDVKKVYDDHNDPCPGSTVKIGGKTKDKDLGCMMEKPPYIGKMPLAACYYDRDNDGLVDCLEDKNVNGLWDKKDGETSSLKFSSTNSGLSDQATSNVVDAEGNPLNPLSDDTDGDGLPDAVEISKGGSVDFYDAVKNTGTCRDASGGEKFWIAVPANSPLQAKGFEFEFTFDTDPFNEDTDGDGISDGDEVKFGYSPVNADSDNDGVCDGSKDVAGAKCTAGEDSNSDGKFPFFTPGDPTTLSFGNPGESNPCDPNTDHHGKFDDQDTCKNVPDENCISPNAMGTDSDSDGIPDLTETQFTGTSPFDKDTDKDGLIDGCLVDSKSKEVKKGSGELCNQILSGQFFSSFDQLNSPDCGGTPYYDCDTNPVVADTDGDEMNDKQERTYPTNPIVKDTDGDCLPDGLEDTHFTKAADGTYTKIPGSIDGTFAGCNDVPAGDVVGKVCAETHADNWDTDGDQLADGFLGIGEDLNCNGVQDLEIGTLVPLETNPLTWDTDADGDSDYAEMTRFGGFNVSQNLSRAVSGRSGCMLVATGPTPGSAREWTVLLVILGLPLLFLSRKRSMLV